MVTLKSVMEWKTHKYVPKLKEADLIPFLTQLAFGTEEEETLLSSPPPPFKKCDAYLKSIEVKKKDCHWLQ